MSNLHEPSGSTTLRPLPVLATNVVPAHTPSSPVLSPLLWPRTPPAGSTVHSRPYPDSYEAALIELLRHKEESPALGGPADAFLQWGKGFAPFLAAISREAESADLFDPDPRVLEALGAARDLVLPHASRSWVTGMPDLLYDCDAEFRKRDRTARLEAAKAEKRARVLAARQLEFDTASKELSSLRYEIRLARRRVLRERLQAPIDTDDVSPPPTPPDSPLLAAGAAPEPSDLSPLTPATALPPPPPAEKSSKSKMGPKRKRKREQDPPPPPHADVDVWRGCWRCYKARITPCRLRGGLRRKSGVKSVCERCHQQKSRCTPLTEEDRDAAEQQEIGPSKRSRKAIGASTRPGETPLDQKTWSIGLRVLEASVAELQFVLTQAQRRYDDEVVALDLHRRREPAGKGQEKVSADMADYDPVSDSANDGEAGGVA